MGTGGRPPLMDIEAVAERLSVGVRHVRRLVTEKRIPYRKWGHLLRFEPDEIEEWIAASDADRAVAMATTDGLRGQWARPALGRRRLAEWVDEWWATTTNLAPSTRVRDESVILHHILPAFGTFALADIGQLDVRSRVADLVASGLAPTTVHKAYQVLSKAMAAAVDAGMLALSPCRSVPLPKVEPSEMRFLSPDEIARLAVTIAPRYRALVLVAMAGSASASWPGCAAPASMCCARASKWPRRSWRSGASS